MILPLFAVVAAALAADDTAVIKVDDVGLSAAELSARVGALGQGAARLSPEQKLDAIVGDLVLAAEARRSGFEKTPDAMTAVKAERTRALAAWFAENGFGGDQPVSDAEALKLYHLGNDTARLSLLVLATEGEAKGARDRLERGGEFGLEAARSLDPASAARRGDTGATGRIQMDEPLAAAAFSAKVGSLIGPIPLKNGFAVARVEELKVADERELPRYRQQIEAYVHRSRAAQAKAHFLEQKRKDPGVTVDDAYISALHPPIDARTLPAERVVATVGSRKITLGELLPILAAAPSLGHGGSLALTRAVNAYVDDVLLAEAAARGGLDRSTEARAALLRAEERALARALGQGFLGRQQPAGTSNDQKMRALTEYISQLRKQHKVWIDKPRALAAAAPRK